jgi:hypothetical protein
MALMSSDKIGCAAMGMAAEWPHPTYPPSCGASYAKGGVDRSVRHSATMIGHYTAGLAAVSVSAWKVWRTHRVRVIMSQVLTSDRHHARGLAP